MPANRNGVVIPECYLVLNGSAYWIDGSAALMAAPIFADDNPDWDGAVDVSSWDPVEDDAGLPYLELFALVQTLPRL